MPQMSMRSTTFPSPGPNPGLWTESAPAPPAPPGPAPRREISVAEGHMILDVPLWVDPRASRAVNRPHERLVACYSLSNVPRSLRHPHAYRSTDTQPAQQANRATVLMPLHQLLPTAPVMLTRFECNAHLKFACFAPILRAASCRSVADPRTTTSSPAVRPHRNCSLTPPERCLRPVHPTFRWALEALGSAVTPTV